MVWPKAILSVAWGIAPGKNVRFSFLAEGHRQPSNSQVLTECTKATSGALTWLVVGVAI